MDIHRQIKLLHGAAAAAEFLEVSPLPEAAAVEQAYPVLTNTYYLGLVDRENPADDPVWKQCMPDPAELDDLTSSFDPQEEAAYQVMPRLIRRYRDRALLLANGRCAIRCRFCFRKRTWMNGSELKDITETELREACAYLAARPEIREVLVSGGDPLLLPLPKLKRIMDALTELKNIEVIRMASRLPAVMPQAVTPEHAELLSAHPSLWLMTHFNHPREVTPEAVECCRLFIRRGVPVLNQTVLLKGVNDSPQVLEELFRKLVAVKVKPHYLFHVDPVRGVRHFATGIKCGLDILRYFRENLSSLAVPAFAIDLPEGGGKVNLQPDYTCNGCFYSIDGAELIEYRDR